ncbi:hypothetical protein J2Y48_000130 [Mycoplana sp. BE70]|uniref:hypothetical protein n=1 Tax=Mycoplana sp. BE70 TaxID=2817775 RepID=UPI00285E055A|nr:hypothetical protein [Mycoplana sp. BE70]MDR6754857.1 hypothetical protein [Mycoplana sp. BE70]
MQSEDDTNGARADGGRRAKPQAPESEAVRARAEERKARLAKTLRDNLSRRKQQARARREGAADETEGLPAAKTDESEN